MATTQRLQTKMYPVVGAHGTGKSTLLARLKGSPAGSTLLVGSEIPRLVCEAAGTKDFFKRGTNTLAKQIHLLFEQLATEVAYEQAGGKTVVLDRCLIDHFAYTKVLFRDELAKTKLDDIINARLEKLCSRYTSIFFIPIEISLIDDGTREGDLGFQRQIDETIRTLLASYRPDYITLTGTVDTRLTKLLDHLSA